MKAEGGRKDATMAGADASPTDAMRTERAAAWDAVAAAVEDAVAAAHDASAPAPRGPCEWDRAQRGAPGAHEAATAPHRASSTAPPGATGNDARPLLLPTGMQHRIQTPARSLDSLTNRPMA